MLDPIRPRPRVTLTVVIPLLAPTLVACASPMASAAADPDPQTRVVEVGALPGLPELIGRLADRRVVFIGESHDRYEDHLNQLRIIEGLHAQGRELAIGMEFFQQPFQPYLDAYVAGTLSEEDMLRRTEYFSRWRFDYRLYRPILRFARERGIPLIALNVASELTDKVGKTGIAGLSPTERAQLPADIDRDDPVYRERLQEAFKAHPMLQDRDFEHFLEAQLLWDEGMAERAARFLAEHPGKTLVVLAGAGHLEYGQGIPRRLRQRQPVTTAIVLNGQGRDLDADLADFLLYPQRVELPATGLLGVQVDNEAEGAGVSVVGFAETSGAKDAGMAKGDRIVRVGSTPVEDYSDLRIALIDSPPGTQVPVEVLRSRQLGASERLTFQVRLH